MRRLAGLAAVLALACAACGSTVAGGAVAGGGANPGSGLQGPGATSQTSSSGLGDSSAAAAAGAGAAPGAFAAAARGAAANGPGQRTSSAAASGGGAASTALGGKDGPGITKTTITIGLTYYQSAKQANEAFGAKGIDFGDPVAGSRVLIKDINAHGGIAGRQVQPLFYTIDPQSSEPYASLAQAECTYFTEDHAVFAVIDGTPAADPRACLRKHGVSVFTGKLVSSELTGNELDAYTARLDRVFSALVPALVAQQWFSPWDRTMARPGVGRATTGIVTVDDPNDNRAVDGVLIPALRHAGYPPDPSDVIRIAPPGGFGDDGSVVAAIDAAVLKLNANGVTHVILNDSNGSLSLLFTNYAYSQNYFPRYGGSTGNGWQLLLSSGSLQAKSMNGAMGIGWQPLFDVPYVDHGKGPGDNATRERCFALFSAAGTPQSNAATAGAQAEGCDVFFLLPALLRGYSGPLTLEALTARADVLGTAYPQASGLGSRFAADQHDGAGRYAYLQYRSACTCFTYTGAPQPMPH